jgi:hypothetical protein
LIDAKKGEIREDNHPLTGGGKGLNPIPRPEECFIGYNGFYMHDSIIVKNS